MRHGAKVRDGYRLKVNKVGDPEDAGQQPLILPLGARHLAGLLHTNRHHILRPGFRQERRDVNLAGVVASLTVSQLPAANLRHNRAIHSFKPKQDMLGFAGLRYSKIPPARPRSVQITHESRIKLENAVGRWCIAVVRSLAAATFSAP